MVMIELFEVRSHMSDASSNLAVAKSAVHPEWLPFFSLHESLLLQIFESLSSKFSVEVITPTLPNIFRAFELPVSQIRVVIVGQDPYPTPGVAIGRAFAVSDLSPMPPSLRNIQIELQRELSCDLTLDKTLQQWAEQGVFLLNTSLTFDVSKQNVGHFHLWEAFTREVLMHISQTASPHVWMLWGNNAQELQRQAGSVAVLKTSHPSPLSAYRGFLGSNIFIECNEKLRQLNLPEIEWLKK
ncbi:MAG: hypothetical protein RLZZ426_796 [Actinomycetota bacterium]